MSVVINQGLSASDSVEIILSVLEASVNASVCGPGLVKLSDLKAPSLSVRPFPITDSLDAAYEEEKEDTVPTVRKRNKKALSVEGTEGKVRGHRQRDFDPLMVEQEEAEAQESREKADPVSWTQNQQKLLELALQQFPRGTSERWDRIAKVVPGKTKVRFACSRLENHIINLKAG